MKKENINPNENKTKTIQNHYKKYNLLYNNGKWGLTREKEKLYSFIGKSHWNKIALNKGKAI